MPAADSLLSELKDLIGACDSADLVQRLAALQLVPANASRLLRLHAATFAACCIPPSQSSPKLSVRVFQQLVGGEPLASIVGHMEDPFYAPFTESFFFYGGDYTVLPGLQEECVYIARSLTGGLYLKPEPFSDLPFAHEARCRLMALLIVSAEMCRRAGLSRNVSAGVSEARQTAIPNKAEFARLRASVTFSVTELDSLLRHRGLSPAELAPFTKDLGSWTIDSFQDTQSLALGKTPLARSGDRVLVASPTDLLGAWTHWTVEESRRRQINAALANRFAIGAWQRVRNSFNLLGLEMQTVSLPEPPPIALWHECILSSDVDKAVHAIVLTDPLTPLPDDELNAWHPVEIPEVLNRRFGDVEQHLFSRLPHLNEVLHLVIFQGVGRPMACGIEDTGLFVGDALTLTGQEFEVFSHLEHGNQLALRQFARAVADFHSKSEVLSFGSLDLYDMYRTHNRSFYLSDDAPPDFISVPPDSGDARHVEVVQARDYHGVATPDRTVLEVTAAYDGGDPPIYFSTDNPSRGLVVEAFSTPIWLINTATSGPAQREIGNRFLDLISYWLCEFAPTLKKGLDWKTFQSRTFVLEISVAEPDSWSTLPPEHSGDVSDFARISCRKDHDGLVLDLRPPLVAFFDGNDNDGERRFMSHLLRSWKDLEPILAAGVTPEAISACLNQYAPLGLKKKFLVFGKHQHHSLGYDAPTDRRLIQQAVEQQMLDTLGRSLFGNGKYKVGQHLSKQDGVIAINEFVGLAAQRLAALIATINPTGLLTLLVAHHETLVRDGEFKATTLPTRLACFHTRESLAKEYQSELSENTRASIALRFIIEHVTATPPQGFRPMSLSLLDDLLALGSIIANFGSDSDTLHAGLANMEVLMLPSHRLGINRTAIRQLQDKQAIRWAYGEIERQTERWQSVRSSRKDAMGDIRERFTSAFSDEFGFGFTELINVVSVGLNVDSETDPVVRMKRDDLIACVVDATAMSPDRVRVVLDSLTLFARAHFWKPDTHPSYEVFPWRFSRALSFSRRPITSVETDEGLWLIWGKGHLNRFVSHFQNLILSARLEAKSESMRTLIGTITSLDGAEFVERVETEVRQQGFSFVRKHAKKFDGLRIAHGGNDLGDVDLLVADTRSLKLFVLECKDLENARTPWELLHERDRMVGPLKKGKTTVEKHGLRAAWIQSNIETVLRSLGLTWTSRWQVVAGIITSVELYGPAFGSSPMRIVSLMEIRRFGLVVAFDSKAE